VHFDREKWAEPFAVLPVGDKSIDSPITARGKRGQREAARFDQEECWKNERISSSTSH
jgi:hypothetical protein